MSEASQASSEPKILGAFTSVVGLLSVALYFTGWMYRYAYFGSFYIEMNALNFPAQSFFFVPVSVFLGNFWIFAKVVLIIFLAISAIIMTQAALSFVLYRLRLGTQNFLVTLLRNLLVVALTLLVLYWLARSQGESDAQRDMTVGKTRLPMITLVHPDKGLGVGQQPESTDEPSLKNTRIIGNSGLFAKLRNEGSSSTDPAKPEDPNKPGNWRLLLSSNGWIYLIRTLPEEQIKSRKVPIVLAVREGGGEQIMILSPPVSKSPSP